VQRAAEALYSPAGRAQVAGLVQHYLGNTRILREGCEAVGLKVYGGVNAPYVWVACPKGVGSWAMFDRMLVEANVVVVPGCGFGACGEGFFRISAFNTRANVEEVVRRLGNLAPAGTAAP
jgi:LL-diaminopimelate aminotransferase